MTWYAGFMVIGLEKAFNAIKIMNDVNRTANKLCSSFLWSNFKSKSGIVEAINAKKAIVKTFSREFSLSV